jgi:hypothetical protein
MQLSQEEKPLCDERGQRTGLAPKAALRRGRVRSSGLIAAGVRLSVVKMGILQCRCCHAYLIETSRRATNEASRICVQCE